MTKIKKGGQEWPFVTDTYYLKDTKDINIYGKGSFIFWSRFMYLWTTF